LHCPADCRRDAPYRPSSAHSFAEFDIRRLAHCVPRDKVRNKYTLRFEPLRKAGFIAKCLIAPDAALGEKVFLKCKACHQIGEGAKIAVGPVLNGVVGRKAGTYPDYSYSDANKNSGITWDEATLKEYLRNPRAKVPGTKMIFPGLTRDDDIDNVIAYLKQFGADGKKS
jgi:cytochrome c